MTTEAGRLRPSAGHQGSGNQVRRPPRRGTLSRTAQRVVPGWLPSSRSTCTSTPPVVPVYDSNAQAAIGKLVDRDLVGPIRDALATLPEWARAYRNFVAAFVILCQRAYAETPLKPTFRSRTGAWPADSGNAYAVYAWHDVDRDRRGGAATGPAAGSGVRRQRWPALFSFRRTFAKVTKSQGATRGATADNFRATLSHCQPLSSQLDSMSGDPRTPPATHRRCLLSSGSRVRILPGALGGLHV